MALRTFLLRGKLSRASREAKRLHYLQRRMRTKMEELAEEKEKGTLSAQAYEEKKAKLEAKRHELIEKLKAVEEQERHLRAELKAAP